MSTLPIRTYSELKLMSIPKIKLALTQAGIPIKGLRSKDDLIQRYMENQAPIPEFPSRKSPSRRSPSPSKSLSKSPSKSPAKSPSKSPSRSPKLPRLTEGKLKRMNIGQIKKELDQYGIPTTHLKRKADYIQAYLENQGETIPPKVVGKASLKPGLPLPEPITPPEEIRKNCNYKEEEIEEEEVGGEGEVEQKEKREKEKAKEKITLETLPAPMKGCVATNIGGRPYQEDRNVIAKAQIDQRRIMIYGVFDGHGGSDISEYLVNHLPETLIQEFTTIKNNLDDPSIVKEAIKQAYLNLDQKIYQELDTNAGSTAIVFIQIGNRGYLVNLGDSRGYIFNPQTLTKENPEYIVSVDQKPNNPEELARIEEAGSFVSMNRVAGILAVARAFGDNTLKREYHEPYPLEYTGFKAPVSPEPEIEVFSSTSFLGFLATDGIWDVLPNDEFIMKIKSEGSNLNLSDICQEIVDLAKSRGSRDNMTFMAFETQ